LKCKCWDRDTLHASEQKEIPAQEYLEDDIPFATIGQKLIVNIPIYHQGYADIYINDMTGLAVDLPGTRNVD
jgi:hypothetical protein